MSAAPFPIVAVIAPAVTSTIVWLVTGSAFALLGAVIAPTVVVAHFLDGRRRRLRDERERLAARARDEAAEREARERERVREIRDLNRSHPSIGEISRHPEWTPARDGSTVLRVGRTVDGAPWLVDVVNGFAVVGTGSAATAVWETVTFNAVAHLGEPISRDTAWRWANGVVLARGDSDTIGTIVRCEGDSVTSLARRGALPAHGDWAADDVSTVDVVRNRLASTAPAVLSITLSDEQPHVLIAGRTGSGKSRVLAGLVVDWARRFTPEEFVFVGIDFKGGATLTPLAALPHHRATITDLDSRVVPRAFAGIAHEMRRREIAFARQGARSISTATGFPRLAIVIDEVHELLRHHPQSGDVIADLARRGRSLGMHLVLAVQHPTGVLRDTVLGNIPVRVCLTMNTTHDSAQVLGRVPTTQPQRGHVWVALGDGTVVERVIPAVSSVDIADLARTGAARVPEPLWQPELRSPTPHNGRDGFGLLDDVTSACHRPATWNPQDGDVAVLGDVGSGKTTAVRALLSGQTARWVTERDHLIHSEGILVVDDLDRIVERLGAIEGGRFLDALAHARIERTASAIVVSSSRPLPRGIGSFRSILTLRTATLDEHRASGAPAETFDPASAPGMGTWRGLRCVVYASTDSIETASIP